MRRNIKAANVLSYLLGEQCQETNNNKINLKNCLCILKFLTYFVLEDVAKCYCTVLSILLYVCLDKVRFGGEWWWCSFFFLLLQLCHLQLAISL